MTFELQPLLCGSLIELRPLLSDDFEALFAAASDPQIWEQHPERDRYKREVFQAFFDGAIASKGAFAIIDRKTGRMIGSSRYYNLDEENREVEIGFTFLAKSCWGGTYNSELKRLMIDHAFQFVDRVLFVAGASNLRSQKALHKIGATFVRGKDVPGRNGETVPCLVFGITRS